jgi:hypothetical protein
VQISKKIVTFSLILQLDELPDGAKVVPDVKRTGWLDTRENAHEASLSTADDSKSGP